MSNDIDFHIVCTGCNCLSIRIEEPLKSSREAVVYCGDCGTPRGTLGALRDLAVHGGASAILATPTITQPERDQVSDEPLLVSEISMRYAELRRLRQQVKIAEWLATESKKSTVVRRGRNRNANGILFRPPLANDRSSFAGGERKLKRPT